MSKPIGQISCLDLSTCEENKEGRTFKIHTNATASNESVDFNVKYSAFQDKIQDRVTGSESDFGVKYDSRDTLDLPTDLCQGDYCYTYLRSVDLTWSQASIACEMGGGRVGVSQAFCQLEIMALLPRSCVQKGIATT